MRVRSFGPVADGSATRLILGSMPGVASLRAGEYYAHPRNLFWRILGELLGLDPGMPYAGRIGALASAGIALWDVLKSCRRAGSLDSSIEKEAITLNDLGTFFARHPRVRLVYFNGATAERYYRRLVLPALPLEYVRLPSTSPAHAALSYGQKLEAWRQVIGKGAFPRGSNCQRGRSPRKPTTAPRGTGVATLRDGTNEPRRRRGVEKPGTDMLPSKARAPGRRKPVE